MNFPKILAVISLKSPKSNMITFPLFIARSKSKVDGPPNSPCKMGLLSNLETESAKLLQVVLFGQPELNELLARPSLRQLQQRITFQHNITALNKQALHQYVGHRMALAGYNGPALFDKKAVTLLYRSSNGIPRLINILCHKALMSAFGQGDRVVTRRHIKKAIQDTESVSMPRFSWLPLGGA